MKKNVLHQFPMLLVERFGIAPILGLLIHQYIIIFAMKH